VLSVSDFLLRAQAPGAEIKPFCLTINVYRCGMDIGHPAAISAALGVTDIMTELRRFTA